MGQRETWGSNKWKIKAENTIFVGDKNYNLNTIRHITLQKIQWTDNVAQNIGLVTLNSKPNIHQTWMITQETFPFRICDIDTRICDIDLSQYTTRFVYMLILIHRQT